MEDSYPLLKTYQLPASVELKFCRGYLWYHTFGGLMLFTTVVNIIFGLRVAALYEHNRKIIILIGFLLLGDFVPELFTCISGIRMLIQAPLVHRVQGCQIYDQDHGRTRSLYSAEAAAWIPVLVVNLTLFILPCIKLSRQPSSRHSTLYSAVTNRWTPLTSTFFRDGIVFFFLIFAIALICFISEIFTFGFLDPASQPWLIAVYSYSGSWLILNLRIAGSKNMGSECHLTTIQFFSQTSEHSTTTEETSLA
ncbi:hypothetical protein BDQ12DRAFT_477239 [Crucibulum laeve]|uniref:G-protein coupled receptors family 1 profile domain-containing protein n=1 Tax=Crucibulum laeve TaxID=68775 RepID=A0A5C3LI04_9AGAR|nr:hypothetical protein BDQ12DRAFT_477239 [Crucibulum laeve]